VDPSKKVPDLNCEVHDLLLEIVDLKQKKPDLRSGGIPPTNFTPGESGAESRRLLAAADRKLAVWTCWEVGIFED